MRSRRGFWQVQRRSQRSLTPIRAAGSSNSSFGLFSLRPNFTYPQIAPLNMDFIITTSFFWSEVPGKSFGRFAGKTSRFWVRRVRSSRTAKVLNSRSLPQVASFCFFMNIADFILNPLSLSSYSAFIPTLPCTALNTKAYRFVWN